MEMPLINRDLLISFKEAADRDDSEVLTQIFPILDNWVTRSTLEFEISRKKQALSLWLVSLSWDKLPYWVTMEWEDFLDWARQRTNYAPSTIINYIRAARVWFNPSLKLPERITLFDKKGQPLQEASGTAISIQPDPFEPPISKLILTSSAFEEGRLDEILLGQIFNRDVSWGVLAAELRERRLQNKNRCITQFFLEGPHLIIREDGRDEEFGELYIYSDEPLVQKGIRHILISAGILVP